MSAIAMYTLLEKTSIGRRVAGYSVTGSLTAAQMVGGGPVAAPFGVALAITGALAYFAVKFGGRH